jgi:hypothetical protein
MPSDNNASRVLGVAFLLQAVTSLVSGAILLKPLLVPGNITESMTNIANNALLVRASIFGDVITAIGIVFLGAILFVTLRKQNENIALVALGLYILEAALLAASRIATFSLLRISQEYVTTGQPADLQTIGTVAFETMDFGYTLHLLPACLGAILFYYLIYKSGIVPRALALWGLITMPLVLIGTLLVIAGYEVPFFIYLPYAPFEFAIGVWILIRGIRNDVTVR